MLLNNLLKGIKKAEPAICFDNTTMVINKNKDEREKNFDLTFEDHKTDEDKFKMFKDIINGERVTNRLGQTIQLKTEEEKKEFVKSLYKGTMSTFIWGQISPELKIKLDELFKQYKF